MYQRKSQIRELYLCIIDAVCVLFSYVVAGLIRYQTFEGFSKANNFSITIPIFLVVHVAAFYFMKLYEGFYKRGPLYEVKKVVEYAILLFGGLTIFSFSMKAAFDLSRLMIGYFVIIQTVLVWSVHQLTKSLLKKYYAKHKNLNKMLLLTNSQNAESVVEELKEQSEGRFELTGIVLLDCDCEAPDDCEIGGIPVVGTAGNYLDYAKISVVDEAFINSSVWEDDNTALKNMILELEQMGIVVHLNIHVPDLGVRESKQLHRLGKYYVVAFSSRFFDYRLVLIKRLIDIVGAIVGLAITLVVGIVLAPILLLESPGPLIFSQNRIGKNGRVFKFYKFRSMYKDAEERKKELMKDNEMQGLMFKMENDPRITKVGKFIRKTSIDELPQFFNVLKGDMSLVGTRPPTMDEYEKYESYQKRRISFKPGITGLWQISGRSNIKSFEEVVQLDLEYIDNWTLWLDIKILCKTVVAVFGGIGAR